MISPDVNVLLYAHRTEFPDHDRYRKWLKTWRMPTSRSALPTSY